MTSVIQELLLVDVAKTQYTRDDEGPILASTLTNIDNELYCHSIEFLNHPSILNMVVYIPAYDFVAHGSGSGRQVELNMPGERCGANA